MWDSIQCIRPTVMRAWGAELSEPISESKGGKYSSWWVSQAVEANEICQIEKESGPDAQKLHRIEISPVPDEKQDVNIQTTLIANFFASELCLRGTSQIIQPHTSKGGDVLCWNGEVWFYLFWNLTGSDMARQDLRWITGKYINSDSDSAAKPLSLRYCAFL